MLGAERARTPTLIFPLPRRMLISISQMASHWQRGRGSRLSHYAMRRRGPYGEAASARHRQWQSFDGHGALWIPRAIASPLRPPRAARKAMAATKNSGGSKSTRSHLMLRGTDRAGPQVTQASLHLFECCGGAVALVCDPRQSLAPVGDIRRLEARPSAATAFGCGGLWTLADACSVLTTGRRRRRMSARDEDADTQRTQRSDA